MESARPLKVTRGNPSAHGPSLVRTKGLGWVRCGAGVSPAGNSGEWTDMSWRRFTGRASVWSGLTALLSLSAMARGQDVENQPGRPASQVLRPAASDENIKSINDEYNQELLQVERRRLERLGRLAARQNPPAAAATYEQLFRLAIASDLFREAEP